MNRTKWMFILGFLGGIFGTLLIISRKSEPQAKPSQPAQSPQPINQRPPGSPQGDVSPEMQKPIRFAILHRIAALILIWTFVFLSLMWIAAFMINWLGLPQSGSIDLDKTQPVPSTSKDFGLGISALGTSAHVPVSHALIIMDINQIKNETFTNGTLSGTLTLAISNNLLERICTSTTPQVVSKAVTGTCKTGSPITTQAKGGVLQLKPLYAGTAITLQIENYGYSDFSQTIPLQQLLGNLASLSVTLPVASQPKAYPDDWYESNLFFQLQLPDSLTLDAPGHSTLPLDVRVASGPEMQDKTVLLEPDRYRNSDDTIIELSTLTERSLLTKLSIYSTAIMIPVAFLILLGYALFILNQKNEDSLSTMLINALIVILTVMAVRQILVPSDIQGEFTRLDLLLIVEGLVLLLFTFFKVTSAIWAYSRTATPNMEGIVANPETLREGV